MNVRTYVPGVLRFGTTNWPTCPIVGVPTTTGFPSIVVLTSTPPTGADPSVTVPAICPGPRRA